MPPFRVAIIALSLLLLSASSAAAQAVIVPGDPSGDQLVNVQDVQIVINQALGLSAVTPAGDVNRDGTVNVQDVQLTINIALGQTVLVAVTPPTAPVNTVVRLEGAGFNPDAASNVVTIGGVSATVQQVLTVNGRVVGLDVLVPVGAMGNAVTLDNGLGTMISSSTVFTLQPNAPPLLGSATVTVDEGATATIDDTVLVVTDADHTSAELTLTILTLPTEGTLNLGATPVTLNQSLTLADLGTTPLSYSHAGGELAMDSFTFNVEDPIGSALGVTTFAITVSAINDAPMLAGPSALSVDEDTDLTIIGLTATDADSAAADVTLTLTGADLELSLDTGVSGGLTGAQVQGGGTATVTVTAPIAAISATLAAPDGLRVRGAPDVNGLRSLTATLDDLGNTGTGGGLFDTLVIAVTINAINDAPVITASGPIAVDEAGLASISGSELAAIDVDHSQAELTLTILELPTDATLSRSGQPLAQNDTLALPDLSTPILLSHDGSENTADSFRISISDPAGGTTGSITVNVVVSAQNDPPVLTVPTALTVDEDVDLTVTGITVADADAAGAELVLSLSLGAGSLTIPSAVPGGVSAAQISGNGGASVTITAPAAAINATLAAGVTLRGALNAFGSETLALSLSDQGATGAGGPLTANASVPVTINSVNDAPVVTNNTGITLDEGAGFTFSLTELQVDDVEDPQSAISYRVVTAPTRGALTDQGSGVSTGESFSQSSISGGGLLYTHGGGEMATDSIVLEARDTAGAVTGELTVMISVTAINDAPSVTVPSGLSVDEDTDLALSGIVSGIVIDDADAGSAALIATFGASNASLTISTSVAGGVNSSNVTGNGSTTVSVTASLSAITTTLADASGLVLRGVTDFNGAATLTVTVDDQGATGAGGSLSGSDSQSITINAVNDPPEITTAGPLTVAEGATVSITASELAATDVDNTQGELTVSLSGAPTNGALTFNGQPFSQGSGFTLADLASQPFVYSHDGSETASDTFELTVTDTALAMSAAATVSITVTAVNDPPELNAPAMASFDEDTDFSLTGLSVNDADAGATDLALTLSLGAGSITVPSGITGGVSAGQISTNGSASVTVTAPQSALNATLAAGLTLRGELNAFGMETLAVMVSDQGASGAGSAQSASASVALTINAVNDAPTVAVNAGLTVNEGASFSLSTSELRVDDVEDASGDITFTLVTAPTNGTLNNQGGPIAETGTFSQGLLGSAITYVHDSGETVMDSLVLEGTDSGGASTGSFTVMITVAAQNDAPVLSAPGALMVDEDNPLTLTPITVSDADVGSGEMVLTLSASNTSLTVSTAVSGGVSAGQVSGNGTASVTITAPVAAINATAAGSGLTLQGAQDLFGNVTLVLGLSDQGQSGAGGVLMDSATTTVTINSINDAPTVTVNGLTAIEGQLADVLAANIAGADVDHANSTLNFRLLSMPANGSVTDASNQPLSVGALVAVSAIDAGTGLNYVHDGSETSSDSFDFEIIDPASATTGTTSLAITVTPSNDAPSIATAGSTTLLEDGSGALQGISAFSDPDAGSADVELTLTGTNLTITVSTSIGGGVTAGQVSGNGSAAVTITAPIAALQATRAASGFSVQGLADFNGGASVQLSLDDLGNTGIGGNKTADATLTVNVTAVNDAPTLDPIANQSISADGVAKSITLTGVSTGPANESGQSLSITGTSSNQTRILNSSISVTGSGPTRTLMFTPEELQLGTVNLTVTAMDSGGTASGGADSVVRTVTLTLLEPDPLIFSISPNRGASTGGEFVTITGKFFGSDDAVSIGGAALTDSQLLSSTTIIGRLPPAPAGAPGNTSDVQVGPTTAMGLFTWNSDGTAPEILTKVPASFSSNEPSNTAVAVQFSEPVDPATVQDPLATSTGTTTGIRDGNLATGTARLSEDRRWVVVRPDQPLSASQTLFMFWTGSPTITDSAGNAFSPGPTFSTNGRTGEFLALNSPYGAAETTAPSLTSSSPSSGTTNISAVAELRLEFSEELDPSTLRSLTSPTVTASVGGQTIPLSISVDSSLRVVTIKPVDAFPYGSSISLTLSSGITDLRGNAFAGQTLSFSTRTAAAGVALLRAEPGTVPISGGLKVRLIGSGFAPGDRILIGGTVCQDLIYQSREELTLTAPAQAVAGNASIVHERDGVQTTLGALVYSGATIDAPAFEILYEHPQTTSAGSSNIPSNSDIILVFSEPADPASLTADAFDLAGSPATSFADSANRILVISGTLQSTVFLTVFEDNQPSGAGLQDLFGNRISNLSLSDARFTLSSPDRGMIYQWQRGAADSTPPTLSSSRPGVGGTIATGAREIRLEFSEELHPAFLGGLTVSDGMGSVPVTVEQDLETLRTLTLRLGRDVSGTVQVQTGGLRDLASQMFGTASLSFTAGTDTTAPTILQMTLCDVPDHLNGSGPAGGTLQAPTSGFTVDLEFEDPGGAGIANDPSAISLSANVTAGAVSAGTDLVPLLPRGNLFISANKASILFPSSLELPVGSVTLTATVRDAAGNSASANFSFTTIAPLPSVTAIETEEVWVFVTGRDFDTEAPDFGNWLMPQLTSTQTMVNANGIADLDEDLTAYGLRSTAGNANVASGALSMNQAARNFFLNRLVYHTALLYGRDANFSDGNPNPGFAGIMNLTPSGGPAAVDIRFTISETDPGSGNRMGFGGQVFPPQVLGRANFDSQNDSNQHNNGANSSRLDLGVFPGNSLGFIFDGTAGLPFGRFRASFDAVTPFTGGGSGVTGAPLGTDASDSVILDPSRDPATFTVAQRARWRTALRALDDAARSLSTTTAHEIGHSLGLIMNDSPPVGLFGNVGTFGSTTDFHVNLKAFATRGGSNIMAPGATFDEKMSQGSLFNRLVIAYLRSRLIAGN